MEDKIKQAFPDVSVMKSAVMKRIITILTVMMFCLWVNTALAQKPETEEEQFESLINELHELGAQQNPDEIDYIPTLEADSIAEVVAEGNCDSDDGFDSSMGRLWVNSISYWVRKHIFLILFWGLPVLLTILGHYLKKRGKRFVGTMLLSSFFGGIFLECICLCIFLGTIALRDSSVAVEFISFVGGLFLYLSCGLGPFLWLVCGLYIYGWAATIYIYKRSESRLRVFGLIATLLCGSILPPLFVIPIVYFISKRYLRNDDDKRPLLYRLIPYYCGSLIGWSAPFLLFWFWLWTR